MTGNGHRPDPDEPPTRSDLRGVTLSTEEQVAALELAHRFPGYFPIVVVARAADLGLAMVEATVIAAQDGAPFTVDQRLSRHGRYVSYHLDLFVASAHDALARRAALADLPGIMMML